MMSKIFDISGRVTVITGATGVLGGSIAKHFAAEGAKLAIIGRSADKMEATVGSLKDSGAEIEGYLCDILNIEELREVCSKIVARFGRIDCLINVAGGNVPGATLAPDQSFFDMEIEKWERVNKLNLDGTVYPCYVFGKVMAEQGKGSIINISSMAALQVLTRVPGYSAAKAGATNFTQWLAVEMAKKYGDGVRVNAVAPGFFIGEQNRAVLINPDGSLTERSQHIIANTPMGRFGDINELNGAVQFLCSDAASFVTGTNLPIDGGLICFSGV